MRDRFRVRDFCISGLPAPHEKADPYVLLSGWPEKWITHYLQSDFIHVDSVIRKVRRSTMGRPIRSTMSPPHG
jgi:hypothetical protein